MEKIIDMSEEADMQKEQILSPEQKDQIVTAAVLLLWYRKTNEAQGLAASFKKSPQLAFEQSDEIMLGFKSMATAAPEFGIDDPVFLFLDIPGKSKEESKLVWEPYFDFAFNVLDIPLTEQRRAFFSGLGFRKFHICIIAYEIDHVESFCVHEYNHLAFPGYTGHPFFDEVMTELLAYGKFNFFDPDTLTLASVEELTARKIDMSYYPHLELFLDVARKHPGLYGLVKEIYESGDMERVREIETLVGKEVFAFLELANPDEYDARLGAEQRYLSAEEAREKVAQILKLAA